MTIESKPSITKKPVTRLQKLFTGKDSNYRRPNWVNFAFLAAFVVLLVITATMSDVFFTQRNLTNLMRQAVTNGLLSLGMLIVILTGGIDLSVGPIVALTGIMVAGFSNQGVPLWLAILICLVVGAGVGAINGFFIARFKLQPFIVTLATLGAIRGLVFVCSHHSSGPFISSHPRFGNGRPIADLSLDHAGVLSTCLVFSE
jgi:ribose/xylose/arabinose/galactoside ABC-type transport system permease subunit